MTSLPVLSSPTKLWSFRKSRENFPVNLTAEPRTWRESRFPTQSSWTSNVSCSIIVIKSQTLVVLSIKLLTISIHNRKYIFHKHCVLFFLPSVVFLYCNTIVSCPIIFVTWVVLSIQVLSIQIHSIKYVLQYKIRILYCKHFFKIIVYWYCNTFSQFF